MREERPSAPGRRWERYEHPHGIGVRSFAATVAEAFEEAGRGLCAVLVDPGTVRRAAAVHIRCGSADRPHLLARYLCALVREMQARRVILQDFTVRLENGHLSATAFGEGLEEDRHAPSADFGRLTVSDVSFARNGTGWRAEFVVGIASSETAPPP